MRKISQKKHQWIAGLIILAAATIFMLLKNNGSAKQEIIIDQPVRFTLAAETNTNIPLEIAGFVRGENRADIAPMSSGRILKIFKHEGQTVKKGEVLATIDASQANAQVSAAQAGVDALKKTLADSEKYYDQLVSQAKEAPDSDSNDEAIKSAKRARDLQIQVAKDQLISAQGALGIAQANKNNSALLAPFAGTITAIHGKEGGFANFSAPLISLSTQNSKEIETYVSAKDGREITSGNIVNLKSADGVPISGTVTAVSAGSDTQSLKTLVRIHLNNDSNNIYLGDFLHGQIMIPRLQKGVLIPRSAVVSRGGDQIVFTLDDNNIAQEKSIKTGSEQDGFIEVTEGVNMNQKIIIEGQQNLTNGTVTKPYESN
ncbi:MAG: membrane-fusion protein [uncultured bacterium]|nr:MAG: membrane-fusion protein [uncultured bacterium]